MNPAIVSTLVRSRLIASLFIIGLAAGCGTGSSEVQRYAIDGKVTYDGQPLSDGEIEFEPDASKGNRGPASKAIIKNSEFSIEKKRGIVGGPYLVRITGFAPFPPAASDSTKSPEPPAPKIVFENHTIPAELPTKQSTQTFEVPKLK